MPLLHNDEIYSELLDNWFLFNLYLGQKIDFLNADIEYQPWMTPPT